MSTEPHRNRRRIRGATLAIVIAVLVVACLAIAGCGKPKETADATSNSSTTATTAQTSTDFKWSLDSDCSTCHSTQAKSTITAAHIAAGKKCVDCHKDTDALTSAHANVTASSKPSAQASTTVKVDRSVCLGCHGSYQELAAKTAGSTVLTDEKGTSANPHAVPTSNPYHQKRDFACSDCHSAHGSADTSLLCIGCHHEKVYECGTCHAIPDDVQ